jgi:hypothetical protein
MTSSVKRNVPTIAFTLWLAMICLYANGVYAQQSSPKLPSSSGAKTFQTPEKAAEELVSAAENFEVPALIEIFGPQGEGAVLTGNVAQDRQHASNFAAKARENMKITLDPHTGRRAFVLVGKEEWPFPVPLVRNAQGWTFDAKAGERELVYRRIGSNELDAIEVCHGYVEAQYAYAFHPREGYNVNQHAQLLSAARESRTVWLGKTRTELGKDRSAKRSRKQSNKVTPALRSLTTGTSSKS